MPAPMPLDAPVTTATLPLSFAMIDLRDIGCGRFDVSMTIEVSRLDLRESFEVGAQHLALQREHGRPAFALDGDEPGGLQLLQVMRHGCRADLVMTDEGTARRRLVA